MPESGRAKGWEALQGPDVVLAAVGGAGLALLLIAAISPRPRPLTAAGTLTVVAGLSGAALATYLWSAGPRGAGSGFVWLAVPLLGASLAPPAAFAVAAGGWAALRRRSLLGPRSTRAADLGRLGVVAGAGILVASLFLPWFGTGRFLPGTRNTPLDEPPALGEVFSGFEAFWVSDVLLVVLAIVAAGAAGLNLRRDRPGPDLVATVAAGLCLAGALFSLARPAALLFFPTTTIVAPTSGGEFELLRGATVGIAATAVALAGGVWATLRRTGGDASPASPGG